MTRQLSEHRHISFTAHYTGYIWYTMGISHPVFATSKGKMLAKLLHPLESWAEKFVGGSMRTTLKQRHHMIDQHLIQLIEQHPDLQVLEIASGLSPRGWNFRQKFPHIDYRELDLPDMAKVKTEALKQIDANSPEVLSVDLFTADFEQAFHVFDPNRPLMVISEGLINYFNKDMLLQLLKAIHHYGENFRELHYLTDIYPEPIKNKLANFIWACSKLLKWMSKSAFSFHFINPQQAQDFFQQAGFEQVSILQPQQYFQNPTVPSPSHEEHLGDLVWMIHASKKNSVI
ncbi:class I SAM-dependent methyltransferase [Acinetobacter sp. A1-4-2]|uniref:Class I SAM-dependent methyltransferase n=1 Tax=Acinetobacter sp. A1-4-2 TaxID=3156489 RepID=A0AAU7SWD6_9GAMM